MPSELQTERRGTTLVLTISDPASRNTLSAQVIAAGIEALSVAESNPDAEPPRDAASRLLTAANETEAPA